jgi:hypothetical protein
MYNLKWRQLLRCFIRCLSNRDKITLESGFFITQEATVQEIKNTHYVLVLESMGWDKIKLVLRSSSSHGRVRVEQWFAIENHYEVSEWVLKLLDTIIRY